MHRLASLGQRATSTFRAGGFVALLALTAMASAQNIQDSMEVDLGSRSIIYNRIETPALKPQPTPALVLVSPPLPDIAPTAEELAAIRAWEAKTDVFLFLFCTVFDRKVTEVRWWREDGEYVIWSGIDFNYLRSLFDFETDTARYTIFLGIGDASAEAEGITLPSLTPTQYQVVKFPKTGIAPEVTATLNELHRYYAANKARLVREFETAEEARIAQEAWLRAHPPVPQDTVINYFPIRSSHGGSR